MNNKNRRLAFFISGVTDSLIGMAFLLIGLGFVHVKIGIPPFVMILIGGIMSITGIAVAVYNLSRWEE
ncbi:MAG: hypothetical protein HY258_03610 [Chloroflexi bacterium]|nr:hypothetical protein [Chloroflexota bacterium]